MAKKTTAAEAAAVLAGSDRPAIFALLRKLPVDVDPGLAAAPVLDLVKGRTWSLGRVCRKLPEPVVRSVVPALESIDTPTSLFLRAYLGDTPTAEGWTRAMNALLDLDSTYAWGSKQRKAKLAALAADPRIVSALQATLVGSARAVRLDMMAVLAIEASDASADALMPHFAHAAQQNDLGLDRLRMLKTHATSSPAMVAMLKKVDALLSARNLASPALELARTIGLGDLELFWFWGFLGSVALTGSNVPRFQSNLRVDSRNADWFHASVSELGSNEGTFFTVDKLHRDGLEVGRCNAGELPAWLARAAKKLGFEWSFDGFDPRSNLRGKKRARLGEWLRDGAAPAGP